MTLFALIAIISLYQINIVHGEDMPVDSDTGLLDESEPDNSPTSLSDFIPRSKILFPFGESYAFSSLSTYISDSEPSDDGWQFRIHRDMNILDSQLLITQLGNINQIISVRIAFYDDDGSDVLGPDGNPIECTSSRQDIGHILNLFQGGFSFAFAKVFLNLRTRSSFDPHSLFFHFSRPLASTALKNNTTPIILGPTSFSIDSTGRTYTVSIKCPSLLTCMWLLDNDVIANIPNTTVSLIFDQRHIGNRTLSYVGYMGSIPNILALLKLSISPSTAQVCNNLPKGPKNTWLQGGNMSSPRIYFTATVLPISGYIMIVGGTADGTTALSSYDVYNPETGCYNTSNMIIPRMQHSSIISDDSFDKLLVFGGIDQTGNATSSSELITLIGSNISQPMVQSRCLQSIARFNNSHIIIVGGRGFNNPINSFELCNRGTLGFHSLESHVWEFLNLEGHSVTSLGNSETVFIFGGNNGSTYYGTGQIADGVTLTSATYDDDRSLISGRAHHQATYIPAINAVLITGGDNGSTVFSDCYLYYLNTRNFSTTGPMNFARTFHAAVRLSNGSVLVIGGAGGMTNNQANTITETVERYDWSTNSFTIVAQLTLARYQHVALLFGAEIFVFGGNSHKGALNSIEYMLPSDTLTSF